MPEILPWRTATDPREIVRRATAALREGSIVAFPTETVYGLAASPLVPEAVERLQACKGRPTQKPLALAVTGLEEALDWAPAMSALGQRLARRFWPGPLTLVVPADMNAEPVNQLSEAVRSRLCPEGLIGFRSPISEALVAVLLQLSFPLVLTSANRSGEPAAVSAEKVVAVVGDDIDLVIDDGPCYFGEASTVARVEGNSLLVLREGVVSRAELERQSAEMIVFVCTGNTCRSPLAEGLCKKLLADRLGCTVDKLPDRGFVVLSAGVSAMMGGSAAYESIEMAKAYGADLGRHSSRPLTAELANQADHLIVMTQGHLYAVDSLFPEASTRSRLLCPEGEDIDDPIGGDQEVYRECAQQLWQRLERLVTELCPNK